MISIRTRAALAVITPLIAAGLASTPIANATPIDDFNNALDACLGAGGGMAFCCEMSGGTLHTRPPYDADRGVCVSPTVWEEAPRGPGTTSPPTTKPGLPQTPTVPVLERV